ncbi:MAG TPA: enoyl-CoA hydratase-related protein, partial [Acidobacteriota bacterium]|nr:enoyl-CoA hydratase-related protein [Acidobacteriota bacterium]
MTERTYETIRVERNAKVGRIWLDRPDVRNAFNSRMIGELRAALGALGADESVRVVVLSGTGTSFCAGADLNWMREIIRFSYDRNLKESLELAEWLYEL